MEDIWPPPLPKIPDETYDTSCPPKGFLFSAPPQYITKNVSDPPPPNIPPPHTHTLGNNWRVPYTI